MPSFTLDTNCALAIDEGRAETVFVRALAEAHSSGRASVAIVAISASERQRGGKMLDNYSLFEERMWSLGLGHLEVLLPMCYFDVMFWDSCLWVEPDMAELEGRIQSILFPNIPQDWPAYCQAYGIDPESNLDRRWKNAKCDVQAFWCHAYNKREVFVTSDLNFHAVNKSRLLLEIAGGRIESPSNACSLL